MIPRGSLDSLTAEDLRLLLNGMGDISTQALIGYTSFNDESSMHSSFLDHFSLSVADIPSRTRFLAVLTWHSLPLHYIFCCIFEVVRSTPSRPNKASVKYPSVRSSTGFFDFNEIWYVGRGRRVMHDGMQYDPIQGQGHEPSKVENSTIFKGYLLPYS